MKDSDANSTRGKNSPQVIHNRVGFSQFATAICLLLTAFMAMVIGIHAVMKSDGNDGNRDFVEYWSAGQLLVHGGNPYESAATLRLEHSAGYQLNAPMITLSPPVIFFLEAPLGFVDARTGSILWLIFLFACLGASIRMLWTVNGRPAGYVYLLSFGFAPVLTCLMAGQIGIVLLLGVTLFFRYYNSHSYYFWTIPAYLAWFLYSTQPGSQVAFEGGTREGSA